MYIPFYTSGLFPGVLQCIGIINKPDKPLFVQIIVRCFTHPGGYLAADPVADPAADPVAFIFALKTIFAFIHPAGNLTFCTAANFVTNSAAKLPI